MEAHLLLIALAVLCALVAGYLLVSQAASLIRWKSVVLCARGEKPTLRSLAALQVETGFGFLLPLSERLASVKPLRSFADRLCEVVRGKGIPTTASALISVIIVLAMVAAVLVAVIARNVIAGCAVAACTLALVAVWSGSSWDKRQNLMREEIPSVLELMMGCFGLGFTLLQTFQQIAAHVPGQLGELFGKAAHVLETGGSVEQALDLLRSRIDVPELAFVVAALEVQHRSGGAITQVLEGASQSVKSELALKRSLRVQTAQAKLSARVVVVMPFILIALFSLVSPGFLTPFFTSFAGCVLLCVALAMQAGGIVLVRRTLDIEGLS